MNYDELSPLGRALFDAIYGKPENRPEAYDDHPYDDEEPDPGEMDGDAESALASVGWGTDEDYGYFGDD